MQMSQIQDLAWKPTGDPYSGRPLMALMYDYVRRANFNTKLRFCTKFFAFALLE